MADISKITLPNGTTYDIKDTVARATAGGGIQFRGVTTTALTDGASTTTYTISGETDNRTAANGDMVVYGSKEFIFSTSDNKWHELGDNTSLGDLAYKDNASGTYTSVKSVAVTTKTTSNKTATVSPAASGTVTYTPAGEITAPTITVNTAGTTSTIKNPTSQTVAKTVVAAAPGATAPANAITYYAVNDETLSFYQLGYTTGASITTANVTVKTGDASYTASAPTFSGTGVRLVTGNIPVPSDYTATITSENKTVTVS